MTAPTKSLMKRIDLGLFTAIVAVLLSLFTVMMEKQTQKARVLPIIQMDMGYEYASAPYTFKVTLSNSGSGIAYVQNVRALIDGKPVVEHEVFQNAMMNGRMFGNAKFEEQAATGFLSPGNSISPWHFTWAESDRSEIEAYLRGEYGPPMEGVDLEVCYCSVFDDCWKALASSTGKPSAVRRCGRSDEQDDFFQRSIAARAADLLAAE